MAFRLTLEKTTDVPTVRQPKAWYSGERLPRARRMAHVITDKSEGRMQTGIRADDAEARHIPI
ncbi:hypothetical protein BSU04_07665 [Caballeronia sordidicola]|uniref:Uncharacterized protein n=1 Tax=Caballeronia sordidicola TaxID=196367 RepID=A0A226X835_CABSO|nr:hypothetical protein BSU04_07665 [Caballeronia sordidicola]